MKTMTMEKLGMIIMFPAILTLFDTPNTNVTTDPGLSDEMKTFYSDYLIDNAEPNLVHDQFGQKHPIPKNGGKNIEFRKYDPLAKITAPITEGVTPAGQKLEMGVVTATVKQYGGYVTLSDMLIWTAIDNNMMIATELLGAQAGRTLDTITRDIINAGTVVQFADGKVSARKDLSYTDESNNNNLNVTAIRMAVRALRVQNAMPFEGGYFVAIIHPDCAYDLMSDPEWRKPHEYVDTEHLYKGEIGEIAGCRFVQTTEAKKFAAVALASDSQTLTVNNPSQSGSTTVPFDGGTVQASALVGRMVNIGGTVTKVTANTTSQLTVSDAITCADDTVIYPGEGGKNGRDVYSTLMIAKNAYGVTEITGGGLEFIAKQLGSGGTADPLNQRATCGWKATKTAERLVEQYMVRIETTSTYNDHTAN